MGMGIRGGGAARQIQALLDAGAIGSLGDGEFLGRFLGRDDSAEPAFAALVDRHGRMVLRVCRDVLGDPHEAQDAAQATFFILARKAAAIRRPEALPSWLHGTARRVASRALRESIRRRKHERRSGEVSRKSSGDEPPQGWPELHEELARLPDRYREPIVLCDLTGLTHEEAAGKLGCPPRTLETRLYRGRERLKDRLVRRGVAPSVALVGVAWAAEARAAWPQGWAASTAGAAVRLASGGSWAMAGDVPANAVRWARDYWRELTMIKLKWVAAAGVLVGMAGGGAWSRMVSDQGERPEVRLVDVPKLEAKAATKKQDAFDLAYVLADGEDVKALTGPAIEARNEHYRGQWDKVGWGNDPQGSVTLYYRWRDGTPNWVTSTSSYPQKVRDLFGPLLGIKGQEVEGDPELLDAAVPADFLIREGVAAGKLVPSVEVMLRRDFHLPARLSLKTVFRDVIVVQGRYQYQEAKALKPAPEGMASGSPRIEISTGELGGDYRRNQDRYSTGVAFPDLLSDLGQFLGRRVVDETKKRPNNQFDLCIADFWTKKELTPEDRARALKNLAEQTSLAFTEEPRGIRVLRVERSE